VDDDGRFPSLIDIFLRHRGSLETVQELIQGVKACTEEEMENWGPGRIRLRASTDPEEPYIMMDHRKEAEKWEHLKELRLWMKHVMGQMSDIVNNRLGRAFCISIFGSWLFGCILFYSYRSVTGSQDLKETSRQKSGFIHATRGGWEQLPLLKDQLLESQEKLLQAYKDLMAAAEEKKEREVALAKAREASEKAIEEAA